MTPIYCRMRIGEVVQLDKHRLMCGDAGNPEHVAALFECRKPDLVFTSPPYLQQRTYDKPIDCWDTLMQRVFGAMPTHEKTQVLVNLGLVHRKGEWLPYWEGWIEWMRTQGWRRFGWYVWDKGGSMPGDWHGRLSPAHEYLFHFCRYSRSVNKSVPCQWAGRGGNGKLPMPGDKRRRQPPAHRRVIGTHKPLDSVLHIGAEKLARHINHPAVFPVALPAAIHAAYTNPGGLVYDPFLGSGTSLIAAQQGERVCYGMELNPAYCDIALQRFAKATSQARLFGIEPRPGAVSE